MNRNAIASSLRRLVVLLVILAPAGAGAAGVWTKLESGLDVAVFDVTEREARDDGDLIVLRLDPALWRLEVLSVEAPRSTTGAADRPRRVAQWCREFGLVAAINAGMYQADRRTHVGFCKIDGRVTNPAANDYLSVLACDPVDSTDVPFRIFDLDTDPLPSITARYRTVIQNLRLIKRSGENRWQPSTDRWSESALGEDWQGRILMIHCAAELSMYELNELLLELPLGLVAAQHLEGSTPARFWIEHPTWQALLLGSREQNSPELPMVLGAARRRPHDDVPAGER